MNNELLLDYPEPKSTATYVIPTLRLSDGTFIFTYLGVFLSYITPQNIPVVNCVLELLRNGFQARMSLVQLIMEALKIESGFICLIALFFLVSLIPLSILLAWGCSTTTSTSHTNRSSPCRVDSSEDCGVPPSDSLQALDETISNALHCRRRLLQFLVQVVILMLIASVTAMIITNEQISTAISKTPNVVRASLKDVEVFLKDVNQQITFSVNEGLNTAINRIKNDFEDIDRLLGEPIETELETSSGITHFFESVQLINTANHGLIHRIQLLHDSIVKAILISQDAAQRTDELHVQLTVMQRQCTGRDRPICDTLRLKSFATDNSLVDSLIKLQTDPALYKMLTLGEQDIEGVTRNLSNELYIAKETLHGLSTEIRTNAISQWADIQIQLEPMKDAVKTSTDILSATVTSLVDSIDRTWTIALPFLDELEDVGQSVWLLTLTIATVTLIISLILMAALSYVCCLVENRSSTTLIVGVTSISMGSIFLALFTVSTMLLGGHGEVFLCRSLYDAPDFTILGKLLDRPGVLLHPNASSNGLIGDLIRPNGYYGGNATLTGAIQKCERNGASYDVFQLDTLMNLSRVVDVREYPHLINAVENISVSFDHFTFLTKSLQEMMEDMYLNTQVDLPKHRLELLQPAPERDLSTFIDQMQRVSLQIEDVATSARMVTLGNRARRLQLSVFKPLEQMRNEIIFHLTALELQKIPWMNQVNNSLMELKSAQFFLNKDSEIVFTEKTKNFIDRLKNHLVSNQMHLMAMLNIRIASCRPLYDIFDAIRLLLCRHAMDPLNGLWFSGLMCLLLWALATPLALALVNIYRRMICARGLSHTNSHQYGYKYLFKPTDSNSIAHGRIVLNFFQSTLGFVDHIGAKSLDIIRLTENC